MSTVAYPHIAIRSDGVPIIGGVGIKVRFLAEAFRDGRTVDELIEDYPLTPSQIYSAWTYYFDHKVEMDKEIEDGERFAEQFLAQQGESLVDEKFREMSDADLRALIDRQSDSEDIAWIAAKLRELGRKLP
ncbi:MAG TPA: DUF433 domain-containing protein [Phycisphaerae bacterium]|nr:DUF433 domain-containing protein [Phycisphaerae bacterium]